MGLSMVVEIFGELFLAITAGSAVIEMFVKLLNYVSGF